jgi:hypothetical protein
MLDREDRAPIQYRDWEVVSGCFLPSFGDEFIN